MTHDEQAHRRAANKAVAVSAIGLALTGGIELVLAIFTGSVALLGDALHNLADVSTSAVVFLGFYVSRRKPSPRYPYGYERAEDIAGLGVALVIFSSALFAGFQSYRKFVSGAGTDHVYVAMAAAVVGIVGNLAVSRYKAVVARRIQSVTMQAEATHSWLDTLSSLGALIGLMGVALGYRWADPVAGFAVTLFILRVSYEVTSEIAHHLMDGVDPAQVEAARRAAESVPGVGAATVRGRWMGRSLIIEVEGAVAPEARVIDAERLAPEVERAIRSSVREVRKVIWIPRPADPRINSD
ncbi:MAG TPA: cation diffusion facilitator family transporter [Candidatus Dormibacteraeota bacterium]|nr:cation diffusion facilitator family transporter [Candidatus Dormibacteraeota bacterium]